MAGSATPSDCADVHDDLGSSVLQGLHRSLAAAPRQYRVVHTTADNSSQQKPLKLTLRAASPKEDVAPASAREAVPLSLAAGMPELPLGLPPLHGIRHHHHHASPLLSPSGFPHFARHASYMSTPLNIITGADSSSSSSSAGQPPSPPPNKRVPSTVSRMRQFRGATAAGSVKTVSSAAAASNKTTPGPAQTSKKARSRTASAAAAAQRKSRTPAAIVKTPSLGSTTVTTGNRGSTARRTNGKRSSATGPMRNGYGVPASIESMSSLKDFINHENFARFPPEMQRVLATLLPRVDREDDGHGAQAQVQISASALKNEYFSKSLDEYLNKGYRAAAMKSQRYPLSTGHNTRQRTRNEEQGLDLSPKDEWKLTYFESYWGEKMMNSNAGDSKTIANGSSEIASDTAMPMPQLPSESPLTNQAADLCQSLQLKQPVVKLTRTESLGSNDDCLLKVATKAEPDDPDCTPPVTPDDALSLVDAPALPSHGTGGTGAAAMGPNSSSSSGGSKSRKRRQREARAESSAGATLVPPDEVEGGSSRKRRRRQSGLGHLQLTRDNPLCMGLATENLASTAALSFVEEQSKGASSTKTGSSSGPSNNSSSSPSTYGETSPQNEELGAHPSEFIKPRAPPPHHNASVAAVAAAAAAAVSFPPPGVAARDSLSLPTSVRHHSELRHASGHTADAAALSRLGGKTVGEMRRDLSYRYPALLQRPVAMAPPPPSHLPTACSQPLPPPPPPLPPQPQQLQQQPQQAPQQHHQHQQQQQVLQQSQQQQQQSQQPQPAAVPRPRRRYALAPRTFERQLKRSEEEKKESPEDAALRRCKRAHEVRLKRLREHNRRAPTPGRTAGPEPATSSFTAGQQPLLDQSSSRPAPPPSSSSAVPEPWRRSHGDQTADACSSSGGSSREPSYSSTASPTPSVGHYRTKNGALSLVFRDNPCGRTLVDVARRHPEAELTLCLRVPAARLEQLQHDLSQVFKGAGGSDDPAAVADLLWRVDQEKKAVHVTFVKMESPTADAKAEDATSDDGDANSAANATPCAEDDDTASAATTAAIAEDDDAASTTTALGVTEDDDTVSASATDAAVPQDDDASASASQTTAAATDNDEDDCRRPVANSRTVAASPVPSASPPSSSTSHGISSLDSHRPPGGAELLKPKSSTDCCRIRTAGPSSSSPTHTPPPPPPPPPSVAPLCRRAALVTDIE